MEGGREGGREGTPRTFGSLDDLFDILGSEATGAGLEQDVHELASTGLVRQRHVQAFDKPWCHRKQATRGIFVF